MLLRHTSGPVNSHRCNGLLLRAHRAQKLVDVVVHHLQRVGPAGSPAC